MWPSRTAGIVAMIGGAAPTISTMSSTTRNSALRRPVLAPLAIRHIVMGDMAVRPLVDNRDAGRPRLGGKRLALSDAAFPYVPSFQGSLAQCLGVAAPC